MPSEDNKKDFDPVYSRRSENKPHYKKKNQKKRRMIGWSIFAILLIIIGSGLIWGYGAYKSAKKTFKETYDSTNIQKSRNVSSVIKSGKPLNILLLGTDTGALGRHDTGRTDTMILASINPEKETVYLTSIARDTKVVVPGDSMPYEKINAAYTIGGAGTAVKTVQNLLNVPIDFYAIINMGGLKTMVDAVGGVTVTPPLTFQYGHANVTKGQKVTLNGKQALDYSRMRDDDPKGDYGRQKRQKQVIQALVMKMINISSLTRYKNILSSLNGNFKSDLTFDDMIAIRAKYGDASHHIKSQTLQGQDAMIDNLAYQVVSDDELLKVTNKLRSVLDLSKASELTDDQKTAVDSGSNTTGTYGTGYTDPSATTGYDTTQQPVTNGGY
ncbi:LCP family protein [Lentilactobacillus senioris]|uniref:LCP family glycopolymer transferase n=1 Tax=Lentilactobacillus senioris TaxID=931534 RepID=UPI00227E106B|nr:LCP family protein [Lentilactobacillus senioris]MCY9807129.1 LCP family protein [Lentilactobacillus senioris]